jgi:hypothetical protein
MEMVGRSMETAETAMEMAPGHFPVPTGCRNRDFCPPKFVDGGGGTAELFLENFRLLYGFPS